MICVSDGTDKRQSRLWIVSSQQLLDKSPQGLGLVVSCLFPVSLWSAGSGQTFVSLVRLPEIDDSNWFEVEVPEADAAVPAPRGEALLAGVHAEDPGLQGGKGRLSGEMRTSEWTTDHRSHAI